MLSYNERQYLWEAYKRDFHIVMVERPDKELIDIDIFFKEMEGYYCIEIVTASPLTAHEIEKIYLAINQMNEREIKDIYEVVTQAFPAHGYVNIFKRKGMGETSEILEYMGRKGFDVFHYIGEECKSDRCPKPMLKHPGSRSN